MLFNELVFGPVKSRRYGSSLGINLLPTGYKVCNFNCIYCECGLHEEKQAKIKYPDIEDIKTALAHFQNNQKINLKPVDAITFAGNGEPLLNPHFCEIVDEICNFRNLHYPNAKINLLSNGYMAIIDKLFEATLKFDTRVFKLDAGSNIKFQIIDQPFKNITINEQTDLLCKYNGNLIVQTMFIKGSINGVSIDNTTEKEINDWIIRLKKINPLEVMIYSLDREAPSKDLKKVEIDTLKKISNLLTSEGIKNSFY